MQRLLVRIGSFLLIILTALAVISAGQAEATPSPAQGDIDAWSQQFQAFHEFRAEQEPEFQIPDQEIHKTTPSEPSYQLRDQLGDWLIIETQEPQNPVERSCITGYAFQLDDSFVIAGGAEERFEQVRSFYNKTGQYPDSALEVLALSYPAPEKMSQEEIFTQVATWVNFARSEHIRLLYPESSAEPQTCDLYVRRLNAEQQEIVLSTLPSPPSRPEDEILSFWYKRTHGQNDKIIDSGLSSFIRKKDSSEQYDSV